MEKGEIIFCFDNNLQPVQLMVYLIRNQREILSKDIEPTNNSTLFYMKFETNFLFVLTSNFINKPQILIGYFFFFSYFDISEFTFN